MKIKMHYRLSKLAKQVIIINIVITMLILAYDAYNLNRIYETETKIKQVISERNVSREIAIYVLEEQGETLFLSGIFSSYFSIFASAMTFYFTYKYAKHNQFIYGISLTIASTLTSLIGGILFAYIIFSGKAETFGDNLLTQEEKNEWEEWVHERSKKT